jgi:hypothetical protein
MSMTIASSRDINGFRRRQNILASYPIATSLYRLPGQQVDPAPENFSKLLLHRRVIHQAPLRIGREAYQYIHIAIRPEILPQYRTE